MQGPATKTHLHQCQDQWTKTTGWEDYNKCSQIPHKPGNQIFV
jgi:hypothetical protein